MDLELHRSHSLVLVDCPLGDGVEAQVPSAAVHVPMRIKIVYPWNRQDPFFLNGLVKVDNCASHSMNQHRISIVL